MADNILKGIFRKETAHTLPDADFGRLDTARFSMERGRFFVAQSRLRATEVAFSVAAAIFRRLSASLGPHGAVHTSMALRIVQQQERGRHARSDRVRRPYARPRRGGFLSKPCRDEEIDAALGALASPAALGLMAIPAKRSSP